MRIASICTEFRAIWSAVAAAGAASTAMRSTRSGAVIAHSSTCMPPIEPPTTAAQRSMPSSRAKAACARDLVADGEEREARAPLDAVGRERGGPGRALASAEHVGRDHEPAVGVDREPRADDAGPPAGGRVRRAGGADDVAVAREGVQHEDRVVAVGRELAPGLVGDADAGQRGRRTRGRASPIDTKRRSPPGRPRARPRSRAASRERLRARLGDEARGHRVRGASASPCLDSPVPGGGAPVCYAVTTMRRRMPRARAARGIRRSSAGVRRERPPWRRARRRSRPRGRP